jgi:hypothetical protein
MESLEKEAEKYADRVIGFDNKNHREWEGVQVHIIQFCEESKWIEAEKIKAQIDVLNECTYIPRFEWEFCKIGRKILQLEKQLKELEDESNLL